MLFMTVFTLRDWLLLAGIIVGSGFMLFACIAYYLKKWFIK